ncbi:hypothetical protein YASMINEVIRUS_1050 [Yasminevirus sp. GU-2018]|uniref:Spore protein YkvP/CgeB glycosyl transferase-like domain-containing protein n=1 Tax=Yasminevirus sp. GU-2018 TaxID=2420051 RepID=A0A5K0U9E2_9VIRU|nr:hypothetical protein YASMINEVIRUS_1050 [Yasminevirus sp. GU-2018]
MTKKILPIVFDESKELSKRLTSINVAHIFCDAKNLSTSQNSASNTSSTDSIESDPAQNSDQNSDQNPNLNLNENRDKKCNIYQLLKTGSYSFIDKFFVTSDVRNINILLSEFPQSPVFLVGLSDGPANKEHVEIVTDVNEAIHKYTSEGMKFYSYKELRELKDCDSGHVRISLDIFLVGKTNVNTIMTRLASMIDSIRGSKIIDGKYAFGTINTYYCGEKKDILLKLLRVDHFIELDLSQDKKYDAYEQVKNTKLYNLIDKTKYNYTWRAYKQIKECIDSVEANSSVEMLSSEKRTPKVCVCIDISGIDPSTKFIDVHKELSDVIVSATTIHEREKNDPFSYGSTPDDREKIYLVKDVFAIGTEKIMRYYMTLFDRYGLYEFKKCRAEVPGCVIPMESYEVLATKGRLLSEVQLFEHIYSFGDVLLISASNVHDNCGLITKKKTIVIVTYYGIYEQFIYVTKALELMGYTVHNFSYMATFNEGGDKKVVNDLKLLIEHVQPNYVLWWVFNIGEISLGEIVKASHTTKHLYYNWDEPYNWSLVDAGSKAKYISSAFITCSETTKKYIGAGALHAYCVYPGYSPTLHRPKWLNADDTINNAMINSINYVNPSSSEDYDCDISFVCTNLYDDPQQYPDQIVDRRKLVESIYVGQKIHGYTFSIYGPEKFREMFPLSYKGFVKYDDTGRVINRSRINMCTHVVGNKKGYLNERVFLILGAGGLLLVDPVPGVDNILTNGVNCIFINQTKICQQIKSILNSYHHYEKIKQKGYETAKNYTWFDWGMRIEEKLLADYS